MMNDSEDVSGSEYPAVTELLKSIEANGTRTNELLNELVTRLREIHVPSWLKAEVKKR